MFKFRATVLSAVCVHSGLEYENYCAHCGDRFYSYINEAHNIIHVQESSGVSVGQRTYV